MTIFLRLLADKDKRLSLRRTCLAVRQGFVDRSVFSVEPKLFELVPGSPFAYAVGNSVRNAFRNHPSMSASGIAVAEGLNTTDNERFLRLFWEVNEDAQKDWVLLAKGGEHSRFYADLHLVVKWRDAGVEMKTISKQLYGSETKRIYGQDYYFRPGLTYSQRTQKGLSFRAFPQGAIFNVKGPAVISDDPRPLALLALMNSSCFRHLVELQTSFGSYNVGYLQKTPLAACGRQEPSLTSLAKTAWSLKRALDSVNENSHAFLLPTALRGRLDNVDPLAIEAELVRIQTEIDAIAFELYGFSEADRAAVLGQSGSEQADDDGVADEEADDDSAEPTAPLLDALLAWAVGVGFGRFDWRLAIGERAAPPDPDPFAPLPARSPGMLPDRAEPFHAHSGILLDDPGHPHDLARLIEEVLARVNVAVPDDVRRWLQRDFFAFHLQRYSKSRRKAPIYWPLSTTSGSYTLWVYYPRLTSQTLYTAINDFVEPKLKQVGDDVMALRNKGASRTRDDEKQFEALQAFELELIELRDILLKLAPTYNPNQDDGVQINAAPLWLLFRHKPWQKILKDTWGKLEKGDYAWAHLAMNYWPDQVREKCKTDKSLAIAHGLEDLYIEPEAKPKKIRGKKKAGSEE
jgi:hypothetical protein